MAKSEKKTVNIPVPEGQTTDTVDADINLEKMINKGSSHNINFNAKSVDAPAVHHKSLSNNCERAIKNIQTLVNCSTNSCGEKLDKKDCCYSKESIMRSIDALQSKHEQLISNQFTMKMEILNLFTDFANSIVDGIEAHIDVLFFFLKMRLKLITSNRIRATCTDCYFDFKVKSINRKYISDSSSANKLTTLLVYPNGQNNRFNTNWREVDHIFIPVFMDQKSH
ncbi:Uncharacterized protein Fot_42238 [Forsythia ovata]|uniref:Uncharacterized protein n=1 Tax=Forsythia ovata TaxID=205694 RepID=A0ABD1RKL1_9LAMI